MTGPGRTEALRPMVAIAGSQLLALSLWFSASAVAPQLEEAWRLGPAGTSGLTLAVQVGFVVGALVSALLNLHDLIAARRVFVVGAVVGLLANAGLVLVEAETSWMAFVLRTITGVALAGVYPSGLKVMAGWFRSRRGMAMGVLVGALTVGSAGPHLVRGLGADWRGVVLAASGFAGLAAVWMAVGVEDGPFEVPTRPFDPSQIGAVLRNRGVRLATIGYLGHMWELYAMWTWAAGFLAASSAAAGGSAGSVSVLTFWVIAVGGVGSWWFGRYADMRGRPRSAGLAMVVSGTCALSSPLVFGRSPMVVAALFLVWGFTVVADSAQFSALVTEWADDAVRGTALTLQTALGFLLTLVTIRGVPAVADQIGWRWAFPWLAAGPAVGVWAMARLAAVRTPSGSGPRGSG